MTNKPQELILHGRIIAIENTTVETKLLLMSNIEEINVVSKEIIAFQGGDIVEVIGNFTGERCFKASTIKLLVKTQMPEYFSFNLEKEAEETPREVALLKNRVLRNAVVMRSHIIQVVRNYLLDKDFLEFETPILLDTKDIAPVDHFQTHSRASDNNYYLRICPENHLKRLLVSGFERVFEIGKNFRDESTTYKNSPEFSVMECYQAHANYIDMLHLTENLIAHVAQVIHGSRIVVFKGQRVDLSPPWKRLSFYEAVKGMTGIDLSKEWNLEEICVQLNDQGVRCPKNLSRREIANLIAEVFIEPYLLEPTFLIDHPAETIAVAKKHENNPGLIERFEGFVCGVEIAHGFSELNDSDEQRLRMHKMMEEKVIRGEQKHDLDRAFLTSLDIGLPPAGGLGIGIDRIVMLMTNLSIQNVKAF